MSTNNESKQSKIVQARRSSLKTHDPNSQLDPEAFNKVKNKRNSVSWGQSNTFQFKAMKAMFTESTDVNQPKKETEEKHQKFLESRKKSIKNEFSIVKELMKNNKNIIEEDEFDEEVKKNTNKNVKIGKDALNEESESGSSSSSESEGEEKEEEK
jgi:hypothetical protein